MLKVSQKCHAKLSFELLPGRRETKTLIESENFDRKLNRDERNKMPFYFLELIVFQSPPSMETIKDSPGFGMRKRKQ